MHRVIRRNWLTGNNFRVKSQKKKRYIRINTFFFTNSKPNLRIFYLTNLERKFINIVYPQEFEKSHGNLHRCTVEIEVMKVVYSCVVAQWSVLGPGLFT